MKEKLIALLQQNPKSVTIYYYGQPAAFHPKDMREINWDDLKSMIIELSDGSLFLWTAKEHALKEYHKHVQPSLVSPSDYPAYQTT